jgi:type VI secretion system secreted protein Hcp
MPYDMFLKFGGAEIPGESTDSRHKGWIYVLSYSWGVSHAGSPGGGGGGGAGKPELSDFSFVKALGAASPALFVAVCKGDTIEEAVFTAIEVGGGGKGKQNFYKVTFQDVFLSGVRPGGQGNDIPLEQITFSYSKVDIEFFDGRSHTATSCDFGKG